MDGECPEAIEEAIRARAGPEAAINPQPAAASGAQETGDAPGDHFPFAKGGPADLVSARVAHAQADDDHDLAFIREPDERHASH
jgi:hypothetical protein